MIRNCQVKRSPMHILHYMYYSNNPHERKHLICHYHSFRLAWCFEDIDLLNNFQIKSPLTPNISSDFMVDFQCHHYSLHRPYHAKQKSKRWFEWLLRKIYIILYFFLLWSRMGNLNFVKVARFRKLNLWDSRFLFFVFLSIVSSIPPPCSLNNSPLLFQIFHLGFVIHDQVSQILPT